MGVWVVWAMAWDLVWALDMEWAPDLVILALAQGWALKKKWALVGDPAWAVVMAWAWAMVAWAWAWAWAWDLVWAWALVAWEWAWTICNGLRCADATASTRRGTLMTRECSALLGRSPASRCA